MKYGLVIYGQDSNKILIDTIIEQDNLEKAENYVKDIIKNGYIRIYYLGIQQYYLTSFMSVIELTDYNKQ